MRLGARLRPCHQTHHHFLHRHRLHRRHQNLDHLHQNLGRRRPHLHRHHLRHRRHRSPLRDSLLLASHRPLAVFRRVPHRIFHAAVRRGRRRRQRPKTQASGPNGRTYQFFAKRHSIRGRRLVQHVQPLWRPLQSGPDHACARYPHRLQAYGWKTKRPQFLHSSRDRTLFILLWPQAQTLTRPCIPNNRYSDLGQLNC